MIQPNDRLEMVPEFAAGLKKGATLASAQQAVRKRVAAQLGALPKIYMSALATGITDESLKDADTAKLRAFTGTWKDYQPVFSAWAALNPTRNGDLGDAFKNAFTGLVQLNDGPAIFNDTEADPSLGFVSFSVLTPFQANSVTIELPGMSDARKKKRMPELLEHLRELDGTLWSALAIRRALAPLYENLNLTPTILISVRSSTISIVEGSRFSSINFSAEVPVRDIDGILWNLLTSAEFRRAMNERQKWIGNRVVAYRDLGHLAGDEPYVIQSDLQIKQLLLAQQGYALTLQKGGQQDGNQFEDIRVQKASDPSGGTTKPKPDAEGIDSHGLAHEDRETPRPEAIGSGVTEPDTRPDKDRTRRIGLQITYKPGQGIETTGLFQVSRLAWPARNGTLSLEGGGPFGNRLSGNYFADFLGFSKMHRRIALRLNGSETVTQHRILNGRKMDETDTGGVGHLEWEPFRDLNGEKLRLSTDVSRMTVSLASNAARIAAQNITAAEFGASYYLQSVESEHPQQTVILPTVKVGLGLSATAQPFAHMTIVAKQHRSFDVWEYNFAGRFESATRSTPIFEEPSFGGANVVRGFRADDGIGLRLWSLQSELLHPVPGLNAENVKNAQVGQLLKGLRSACFYDVGGVYQTTRSASGERSGIGAGVHVDMKLAVFKVDWAYGFGQAASGGSRGKFYFGIQLNVPE